MASGSPSITAPTIAACEGNSPGVTTQPDLAIVPNGGLQRISVRVQRPDGSPGRGSRPSLWYTHLRATSTRSCRRPDSSGLRAASLKIDGLRAGGDRELRGGRGGRSVHGLHHWPVRRRPVGWLSGAATPRGVPRQARRSGRSSARRLKTVRDALRLLAGPQRAHLLPTWQSRSRPPGRRMRGRRARTRHKVAGAAGSRTSTSASQLSPIRPAGSLRTTDQSNAAYSAIGLLYLDRHGQRGGYVFVLSNRRRQIGRQHHALVCWHEVERRVHRNGEERIALTIDERQQPAETFHRAVGRIDDSNQAPHSRRCAR